VFVAVEQVKRGMRGDITPLAS